MANDLTFNQLSTVLNSIVSQATGSAIPAVTDTSSFITVGQTALKCGYDTLATSISQVLSKTIFSVRPYNRLFGSLEVSNIQYGNHVRKLTAVDSDWEDDESWTLTDGQAVDQYKVKKPKVLQSNFYGAEVYERFVTIYRHQLDQAFSNPDEFGRFLSMIMQNASDQIEQAHENTARMTVVNFLAGKISVENGVVHLLTEYNDLLGLDGTEGKTKLTASDLMKPDNFVPFVKWMYARIKTVSDLLRERSQLYHINVKGQKVSRHTPYNRQKLYMYTQFMNNVDASVMSGVFNDEYMRMQAHEPVSFWQSILSPQSINVTPSVLQTDGTVKKATAVNNANVIGVLFDEEAMGYTVVNQWSSPTPFNAKGGYYNQYWHFTDRYWNDFTENGVVFVLD